MRTRPRLRSRRGDPGTGHPLCPRKAIRPTGRRTAVDIIDGAGPGPASPQLRRDPNAGMTFDQLGGLPISEDCLRVSVTMPKDVHTPRTAAGPRLDPRRRLRCRRRRRGDLRPAHPRRRTEHHRRLGHLPLGDPRLSGYWASPSIRTSACSTRSRPCAGSSAISLPSGETRTTSRSPGRAPAPTPAPT